MHRRVLICAFVRVLLLFAFAVPASILPSASALAQSPLHKTPTPLDPTSGVNVNARAQYDAGTRAFADKRFVEAALDFEAAAGERPTPVALYTAALSWERANVPDRAADDYTRSLAGGGLPPEQGDLASQRLAALETVLGSVFVRGPEGSRVQLDANTELPVPATLHGAAGVHTLTAVAPGRPVERVTVVLTHGATTEVEVGKTAPVSVVASIAPNPTRAPAAPTAADVRRMFGLVVLGAAGTALVAGVLFGFEAIDARDAFNAAPAPATYDHAARLQVVADAAFVTGGVLLAGGLALAFWPSPPSAVSNLRHRGDGVLLGVGPRGAYLAAAF